MNKLTTEQFKENFVTKFGDIYDFSETEYVNNKKEILVVCHQKDEYGVEHGKFWKRPDLLMDGCKCPKCSKTNKTSEEDFIKKAKFVHNNFFSYVLGSFKNVSSPVGVICPHHGIWYPKANNHLQGANCPKCQREGILHEVTKLPKREQTSVKLNTEKFKEKVVEKFGEKYLLDKVEYVNYKTPVIITCRKHGDFLITPNHLLGGRGCSKCSKNYHFTTEEIIERFNKKHNNRYNYDKTEYTKTHDKIIVTCPIHGDFEIMPSNHLRGQGCPVCNISALENDVKSMLDMNGIEYSYRERKLKWLHGLELDFYIPELDVAIECQGIQHFEPIEQFGGDEEFEYRIRNDEEKRKLCNENGVKLLYYSNLKIKYPYKVFKSAQQLLNEIQSLQKTHKSFSFQN